MRVLRQDKPYQLPERPCETCPRCNRPTGCAQRIGVEHWPGCMRWVDWFRRCWQMVRGEAPEAGQEGV